MQTSNELLIGIAVVLFFIWRFARTLQLYRYSHRAYSSNIEDEKFRPSVSREFFNKALLGNRSVKPNSFFIRALVFVIVTVILLPFKDYAPGLFLIFTLLVVLYVPWCVGLGLLLRKQVKSERGA